MWLPSFKADKVVLVHLNFGGVFDEENSFVRGNEFPKDIQERCFLADEPTGNLDSKNGDSVMDLLRDIHQSGTTICMVTHDPRYANHAERTVHLFDGKIVEETQTAS